MTVMPGNSTRWRGPWLRVVFSETCAPVVIFVCRRTSAGGGGGGGSGALAAGVDTGAVFADGFFFGPGFEGVWAIRPTFKASTATTTAARRRPLGSCMTASFRPGRNRNRSEIRRAIRGRKTGHGVVCADRLENGSGPLTGVLPCVSQDAIADRGRRLVVGRAGGQTRRHLVELRGLASDGVAGPGE